jgi:hypothetical protein
MDTMQTARLMTAASGTNALRIGERVTTGVFAVILAISRVAYLIDPPPIVAPMRSLGYPDYFRSLLGVVKLLGAAALILPSMPRLREWAYAGFIVNPARRHRFDAAVWRAGVARPVCPDVAVRFLHSAPSMSEPHQVTPQPPAARDPGPRAQSKRGACAASRGRRLGGRSRSRPGVAADSARPGRAGKRSERMQSAAPLL